MEPFCLAHSPLLAMTTPVCTAVAPLPTSLSTSATLAFAGPWALIMEDRCTDLQAFRAIRARGCHAATRRTAGGSRWHVRPPFVSRRFSGVGAPDRCAFISSACTASLKGFCSHLFLPWDFVGFPASGRRVCTSRPHDRVRQTTARSVRIHQKCFRCII